MRVCLTLRSDDADRWEELRDELENRLGYRPNHPETARLLLAGFDADAVMQSDDDRLGSVDRR